MNKIKVLSNHLGYYPKATKELIILGKFEGIVCLYKNGVFVIEQNAKIGGYSSVYGDFISYVDFSMVEESGDYSVIIGEQIVASLKIGNDVYDECLRYLFEIYEVHKCGQNTNSLLLKEFNHTCCHDTEARLYGTTEYKDVSGGWHDAGDYGRYVVPAAKTVFDLLLSSIFTDNDASKVKIISTVEFEIRWLLKMQREDGAVYHKVTCAQFPGMVLPEDEKDELIISPISTAATADFISALCLFMSLIKTDDITLLDDCRRAVDKAYNFLLIHPVYLYKNPVDIQTGEYDDNIIDDEMFLVYCSLYYFTGKQEFQDKILPYLDNSIPFLSGLGWEDMGFYGLTLFLLSKWPNKNKLIEKRIEEIVFSVGDEIVQKSQIDGFHISSNENFKWGSNMYICNNAFILSLCYNLSKNEKYLHYAQRHLDYILGENILDICFVTGFGNKSPSQPHHRPSAFLNCCMKGMLVGGVSDGLQDDFARENLSLKPIGQRYIDNVLSYSTNEITIYWNSILILLLINLKKIESLY